jgi:hypothetical protein
MSDVTDIAGCLNLLGRLIREKESGCDCKNGSHMPRENELLKAGRKAFNNIVGGQPK